MITEDFASNEFAFEQSLQKGIMDGGRRGGKPALAASSFFHRLPRKALTVLEKFPTTLSRR